MPTNVQLMAQIDAAITDKTTSASISPADVGDNIKDVVGYVDQEIDALSEAVTEQIELAQIQALQPSGSYDPSVGTFPTVRGQGGAVTEFNLFQAIEDGTMTGTGSLAVLAGEYFYSLVDTPGQIAANWDKLTVLFNQATTVAAGVVRLAASGEIAAGDGDGVMTATNTHDYVNSRLASNTVAGIVELATETEMTAGTSTELVPPIKVVKDYVANELAGYTPPSLGYTQYIVSLTQAGTSDPTVVINKNTLGITPVVGYGGSVGRVSFFLTGISNAQLNKVRVILSQKTYSGKTPLYYYTITGTANIVVNLFTYNLANNALENDMLINTPFEIQIFP